VVVSAPVLDPVGVVVATSVDPPLPVVWVPVFDVSVAVVIDASVHPHNITLMKM
jgi:hypothetical protein